MEKKKNAITRLLSQVVVRLAERPRNVQHFGKEQNRERGFCRGNRTVRVSFSRECIEIQLGKKKNGDTRLLSHYVAGCLCSVQSPAIWKRSKNCVRGFCCKILPTGAVSGCERFWKEEKSRTRLLYKYSVPVAQKWGYQSGTRSQESEGAVASMGGKAFGYRWSERRFRVVIPGIVSKLGSMSTLAGFYPSRTVPYS